MRGWLMVGGQVVLLALLLVVAVRPELLPGISLGRVTAPGIQVLALVLMLLGVVVLLVSARQLGTALTPHPKPREQAALRTDGMYGAVRHPIYTGLLAVGWGLALHAGLLIGDVLALLLTALLAVKSRYEEQLLSRTYAHYGDYRERTGRFLPRLRRGR